MVEIPRQLLGMVVEYSTRLWKMPIQELHHNDKSVGDDIIFMITIAYFGAFANNSEIIFPVSVPLKIEKGFRSE